jgi:potassium-dependent mechanosensitive channel
MPATLGKPLPIALIVTLLLAATSAHAQHRREPKKQEKSQIELSLDTVMGRIDDVQQTLTSITSFREKNLDTADFRDQVARINHTLDIIRHSLSGNKVLEYKQLLIDQYILQDIHKQLETWRSQLFSFNNDLVKMNAEMTAFYKDSMLRQVIHDSAYREMYEEELKQLGRKWDTARKITAERLKTVVAFQSAITKPYFETTDLLDQVNTAKNNIASRLFHQETPYLWHTGQETDTAGSTEKQAMGNLRTEKNIMGYFLERKWGYYCYVLLIGLAFFIWVSRNFRIVLGRPDGQAELGKLNTQNLRNPPVISSLIILLNIFPFFNFNAPTLLAQFVLLLLLILTTLLFIRHWPLNYLTFWLLIILLYILFMITGALLVPKWGARIWLVALNAGAIVLGYYCTRRIMPFLPFPKLTRIALWVFLILNGTSIIANVMGRISIARLAGITAIFGLVQIVLLSMFVESVVEGFRLQILTSRLLDKDPAKIALLERLQKGVFRSLIFIAAVIWLVAFSINLNIYDIVYSTFQRVMNHEVRLGSVAFRIGNVILFLVIVYLSHILQKYIGFLYGSADGKNLPHSGRKGSRLVMIRLVLIIGGFLFAIVASGLPIDRITIVLGALGVGIGLGLQNIVNNLVSGIILIFERPFQIGDYIELNGKKGIVRDIGIRASRLVTEDGTEIIMPNGDLISGEVINWTIRNSEIKIEIPLTVGAGHTYEELKKIVEDALKDHQDLSKTDPPRVLLTTSTDKTISFTVMAWVQNIGQIQTIKSEVLRLLIQKLRENNIRTV